MQRRKFIVKAGGVLAAVGRGARRERPERHRPAAGPVAHAHDVAPGERRPPGQRPALRQDGRRADRWPLQDPGLRRRRADAAPPASSTPAPRARWRRSTGPPTTGRARRTRFQWFTSVPFGLNTQGYFAWYHQGDGLKLWEEAYAPFGVVPRPAQSTNPQMVGWFRKKINTIDDLKGLKIRIPGPRRARSTPRRAARSCSCRPGRSTRRSSAARIDATEFIGPHDDLKLGFQNAARYYYYPGWHEPTSIAEFSFNKKAYDASARGVPATP